MLETLADELTDAHRPLTDTAREDEGVEPAKARDHGGDARAGAMDVDGEREAGLVVLACQQLPHIAGPGEPQQTRLVLEGFRHVVRGHALVPLEPQEQSRVDRSGAGGHDKALEWR